MTLSMLPKIKVENIVVPQIVVEKVETPKQNTPKGDGIPDDGTVSTEFHSVDSRGGSFQSNR